MTDHRRFVLIRDTDVTGVSGTGLITHGCQLPSGKAVMEWATAVSSVAIYPSVDDLMKIHGHDGATRFVWVD